MVYRIAASVLFVALTAVATLAQAPPAAPPVSPIAVTNSVARDGTRYQFEISRERASGLPQWDPRAVPDPPLSMNEARKAAESWLASRAPEINAFVLSGLGLFRLFPREPLANCAAAGCWYYRMTFDLVVGGRRLASGGDFTVVVLHDGSIVEPRMDTSVAAAPGAGRAGGGLGPGRGTGLGPVIPGPNPNPIPGPDGVYRAGNGVSAPTVVRQVTAEYPLAAMREKIQGIVVVEGVVKTDGTMSDVRVVKSLDSTYGLDDEAVRTAKQWRFTPGTLAGRPVAVLVTIEIQFKLR
jgi:TonB family protein